MFEDIIKALEAEREELRPKRVKCEELMGKVGEEKRRQLEAKYKEICRDIDRATLCISILDYTVSVETSADFTTIRFSLLPEPAGSQASTTVKEEMLL